MKIIIKYFVVIVLWIFTAKLFYTAERKLGYVISSLVAIIFFILITSGHF